MMLDATQHYSRNLSKKRLFAWHASLFPEGNRPNKIKTGAWRTGKHGPMRVVSSSIGKEKVHFEAPEAKLVEGEMKQFLEWINAPSEGLDPVLRAAIAHLWFVTIHPFEDGNGRIARAITDMLLARADASEQRFYSLSTQIQAERKKYYEILETTQKGSLDITPWLEWFLNCMGKSVSNARVALNKVLAKAGFWRRFAGQPLNDRQRVMINKLLDGFEGKLTSSKWAKIAKCSQDTALRDIQGLMDMDILVKDDSGGRSTGYVLKSI